MDGPARVLLSIHDVMPETLDDVAQLIEGCLARGLAPPALLVVPGRSWDRSSLDRLRNWEQAGAELVAHGWMHRTRPRRLYHRLHAALVSRDVAEHLDLRADGIIELMRAAHAWFPAHGLASPTTYIPPAWALGMAPRRLSDLPYRCIETLGGLLIPEGSEVRRLRLPLMGFEADTALRAAFLRRWNRGQLRGALRTQRPLRVSIHPADHRLRLKEDLGALLDRPWTCLRYDGLAAP